MRSRKGRRRPMAFLLLTINHDKEKKKRDKIEGRLTQEHTRLISLERSLETSSFKQYKRRPKGRLNLTLGRLALTLRLRSPNYLKLHGWIRSTDEYAPNAATSMEECNSKHHHKVKRTKPRKFKLQTQSWTPNDNCVGTNGKLPHFNPRDYDSYSYFGFTRGIFSSSSLSMLKLT